MNPQRRKLLRWSGLPLAAAATDGGAKAAVNSGTTDNADAATPAVLRGRTLVFPRDHGAHPSARIEWWYATGWLGTQAAPTHGFQVTFFRSRSGLAESNRSRFAARQLLSAHAAVTQLQPPRHLHDQRIVRWSGDPAAALGRADMTRGGVEIGRWSLQDETSHWQTRLDGSDFKLDLRLVRTQPLLLQGEAGHSRKGPREAQASHYYSEPQLTVAGRIGVMGRETPVVGRAWLDHEWSDQILDANAVGWDWIGINLFDGSALTAFVLRRRDGSSLWAGGSFRAAGSAGTSFAADAVRFMPGRRWRSASSGASYPVEWLIETPAGRFEIRALMDEQELDSRASTGTIYWEGLSELLNSGGQRVGLGYLEMTGYAAALRL